MFGVPVYFSLLVKPRGAVESMRYRDVACRQPPR